MSDEERGLLNSQQAKSLVLMLTGLGELWNNGLRVTKGAVTLRECHL